MSRDAFFLEARDDPGILLSCERRFCPGMLLSWKRRFFLQSCSQSYSTVATFVSVPDFWAQLIRRSWPIEGQPAGSSAGSSEPVRAMLVTGLQQQVSAPRLFLHLPMLRRNKVELKNGLHG